MDKPITTIDEFAEMIQRTMASKEDIQGVNVRLDGIDSRLDRIEHLLLAEWKRDIADLKARVKRLEDALAV
jgi:hypothetical protein